MGLPCRRWTQWKRWAYRGVDAGLARFGVPVGSNLTSHLEWLGSTVRFQRFLTEALQKCINERPLFWGTESDPPKWGTT